MKLILITGNTGSGKTTLVKQLANRFLLDGLEISGFISEGNENRNEVRTGYVLSDLISGKKMMLCSKFQILNGVSTGHFTFSSSAVLWGNQLISEAIVSQKPILIIDEVGPLEIIKHEGWWESLVSSFNDYHGCLFLVVRQSLVDLLAELFQKPPDIIIDASKADIEGFYHNIRLVISKSDE